MKATSEEYDFHCRILARNDPTAFAMLAEQSYTSLVQRVQRRAGPHGDAVLIEEAVGQALLDYPDAPERYDPKRSDLHGYLAMVAYHDFQNAQAKEQRATRNIISLSHSELQQLDIEDISASPESIESEAREQELWRVIDATFPDPTERQIVLLILNHVRAIGPYARLLELTELPPSEQREHVYRVKERLKKRLRRNVTNFAHM